MAKALCLKVENSYGEKAIVFVKRMRLLNRDLRIERKQNYLYIPLIREPQKTDLKELETNLPEFEVLQAEFHERVEHPPKLVDLLSEKLPPHLFATLPHAIDFVGDIAIVETPPELQEYKPMIGKAIIATHKGLTTVL